jgi:hypothetical protein
VSHGASARRQAAILLLAAADRDARPRRGCVKVRQGGNQDRSGSG